MSSELATSLQDVTRAITLWPEWAGSIAYLDKRVENRTWEPPKDVIGTRIAIHAGAYTGGGKGTGRRIEGLTAVARMATRSGWQLRRDGSLRKDGSTVALTSLDARCGAILATAVVVGLDAGSPAQRGGVQRGDVIVRCNGEAVRGPEDLTRLITAVPEGGLIRLLVERDGGRAFLAFTR